MKDEVGLEGDSLWRLFRQAATSPRIARNFRKLGQTFIIFLFESTSYYTSGLLCGHPRQFGGLGFHWNLGYVMETNSNICLQLTWSIYKNYNTNDNYKDSLYQLDSCPFVHAGLKFWKVNSRKKFALPKEDLLAPVRKKARNSDSAACLIQTLGPVDCKKPTPPMCTFHQMTRYLICRQRVWRHTQKYLSKGTDIRPTTPSSTVSLSATGGSSSRRNSMLPSLPSFVSVVISHWKWGSIGEGCNLKVV